MIVQEDVYLEHFGIKGMRWGVRNDTGASSRTNREASKDAKEFARAKLFYGEGAGTRRKLIKATVEAKKAKDPSYAKAFDSHLNTQDLSTHASKARKERSSKDRRKRTKQIAGQQARRLTGEMGTTAAFTAAVVAGATYLNSPRGRQTARNTVRTVQNFANSKQSKAATDFVSDYFSRQG